MGAALRYELVRVTTIRSTRIMAVLSLLMGLGLGWLASQPSVQFDDAGNELDIVFPVQYWQAFSVPLLLVAVLASVVGAQALGQEYRFGLVRDLTAFPRRGQVLTAKVLVVVAASAVFTLVSYAGPSSPCCCGSSRCPLACPSPTARSCCAASSSSCSGRCPPWRSPVSRARRRWASRCRSSRGSSSSRSSPRCCRSGPAGSSTCCRGLGGAVGRRPAHV
jgi:hypothetical protein